jgi:hypothetical protein
VTLAAYEVDVVPQYHWDQKYPGLLSTGLYNPRTSQVENTPTTWLQQHGDRVLEYGGWLIVASVHDHWNYPVVADMVA